MDRLIEIWEPGCTLTSPPTNNTIKFRFDHCECLPLDIQSKLLSICSCGALRKGNETERLEELEELKERVEVLQEMVNVLWLSSGAELPNFKKKDSILD